MGCRKGVAQDSRGLVVKLSDSILFPIRVELPDGTKRLVEKVVIENPDGVVKLDLSEDGSCLILRPRSWQLKVEPDVSVNGMKSVVLVGRGGDCQLLFPYDQLMQTRVVGRVLDFTIGQLPNFRPLTSRFLERTSRPRDEPICHKIAGGRWIGVVKGENMTEELVALGVCGK